MNAILQAKRAFLSAFNQIEQIIKNEVFRQKEFIEQLNREQLKSGTKADGTDMPNYVEGSKQPSAPGKINLFETGEFYNSIAINEQYFDEYLALGSEDEKAVFLVAKYGEILGLTKANQQRLVDRVMPNVMIELNKRINERT